MSSFFKISLSLKQKESLSAVYHCCSVTCSFFFRLSYFLLNIRTINIVPLEVFGLGAFVSFPLSLSPALRLSAAARGLFTSVQYLRRKGFWAMCLP